MHALPHLYVRPSPLGGRGVFTSQAIQAATVVELAPVILLSPEDRAKIHQTRLHDYYFQWDGAGAVIALGFGSLYNHSDTPNLAFKLDYDFEQIRFSSLRKVAPGTELTINYRAGDRGAELWF